MTSPTTAACLFCIDGNMPAGSDTDLGELYERCPACVPVCRECDGIAVFPARTHCLYCFVAALIAQRLAPVLCPGCAGVITVIDLDQEAAP
jgi:hypothetical protein